MKRFYGVPVHYSSYDELVRDLYCSRFTSVATINAQYIVEYSRCPKLRTLVNRSRNTIDGAVPLMLKQLCSVYWREFSRLSGSRLIFSLSNNLAKNGGSVFLVGAESTSNKGACDFLNEKYGLRVAGYSPSFGADPSTLDPVLVQELTDFRPTLVFVGLGILKQEQWIDTYRGKLEELGVSMAIGCGGAIDMASGRFKVAPSGLSRLGLESIYRLMNQPSWLRFSRILLSFGFLKFFFK